MMMFFNVLSKNSSKNIITKFIYLVQLSTTCGNVVSVLHVEIKNRNELMSGDLKEITTTEAQNDVTVKYQLVQSTVTNFQFE